MYKEIILLKMLSLEALKLEEQTWQAGQHLQNESSH